MAEFKEQGLVNKVTLMGAVKESKLIHNVGVVDKFTNEKYNSVGGELVIKCGDFREITLKVFEKEFTKNGKDNKKYINLLKLVPDADGNTESPTMAKHSEEEAIKVSVWGQDFTPSLKDNFYVNKEGELAESIQFNLGFGNITFKEPHQVTPEQYEAKFDVKVFVYSVDEELVNEVGTGRAKVKAYIPQYNGTVIPLTITAGVIEDELGVYDFGRDVLDRVQPGDTLLVWGDVNFAKIVTTKTVGDGANSFGRAKVETKTSTVREFFAMGAELIDDYEKAFEMEDIQKAVKERNIAMQDKLKESQNKKEEPKGRGNLGGERKPSPVASKAAGADNKPKRPAF